MDLLDEDAAAVAVAQAYARELDGASALAAKARKVLDRVPAGDADLLDQVQALKDALSARSALATFGPKLHALLDSLGATPGGRAKQGKGKPAEPPAGSGALAALRSVPGA